MLCGCSETSLYIDALRNKLGRISTGREADAFGGTHTGGSTEKYASLLYSIVNGADKRGDELFFDVKILVLGFNVKNVTKNDAYNKQYDGEWKQSSSLTLMPRDARYKSTKVSLTCSSLSMKYDNCTEGMFELYENAKYSVEYYKKTPVIFFSGASCDTIWSLSAYRQYIRGFPHQTIGEMPFETYLDCVIKEKRLKFGDNVFSAVIVSSDEDGVNTPGWLEDVHKYPWLTDVIVSVAAHLRTISRKLDKIRETQGDLNKKYSLYEKANSLDVDISILNEDAYKLIIETRKLFRSSQLFMAGKIVADTRQDVFSNYAGEIARVESAVDNSVAELSQRTAELSALVAKLTNRMGR